jgi:hypothetical protein
MCMDLISARLCCCRLKLEAVLSSQLPRQVTAVTYLTTLSLDRRVRAGHWALA